jgi:hypothetical protein
MTETSRYHWFCCQCPEGPIALEDGNGTDEAFVNPEEVWPCSHLRCSSCEVAKNTSGDLLEKFLAELDNCNVDDGIVYHWLCCKCDGGPMGLNDLQDVDKCSSRDCGHDRCDSCSVAKGTEDNEGNMAWNMLNPSSRISGNGLKRKREAESETALVGNEDGELPTDVIFVESISLIDK